MNLFKKFYVKEVICYIVIFIFFFLTVNKCLQESSPKPEPVSKEDLQPGNWRQQLTGRPKSAIIPKGKEMVIGIESFGKCVEMVI